MVDIIKQHYGKIFVLGTLFEKYVLSEGLATQAPPSCENSELIETYRWNNGFTDFHMRIRCNKTPQMHLKMSPTYFEEPGPRHRV